MSFGGPRYLRAWLNSFPTSAFTISLNVRSTAPGMLVSLGDQDTGSTEWAQARFTIDCEAMQIGIGFGQTLGVTAHTPGMLLDGRRHHIVVTWSQPAPGAPNATVVVYVDGVVAGQRSWTFTDDNLNPGYIPQIIASGPLYIGYRPTQHNEPDPSAIFDGAVTDLSIWSRAMTPAEIAADATTVVTGNEPGLYLALPMGPAGRDYLRGSARDLSPNHFDASDVVMQDTNVCFGSVWRMEGFPTGSRTVAMWLRCGFASSGTYLLTYSDYSNSEPPDDAGPPWSIADPSSIRVSSSGSFGVGVADGTWHHVAIVCHRERGEPLEDLLYIDGELRARLPATSEDPLANNQRLVIGGRLATNDNDMVYRGEIAGFAIWSAPLAHHDILQEMQRGVVAVPELPTLVARWPLAPEEAGLGPGVSPGTSFGSSRWGGAIVRPAPAEEPEDPALYFIDRHDPTLKSGTYSIQVQQTIQGETFGTKADFHVSGPRFHCVPSDILAQYPPPASTGDYGRVLPHVILTRSTLPWERAAMPGTPWLVLALFDNGEIIDAGVKPLRALQLVDAAGQPISADTAAGESDDDTVSYITVAGDTLAALLPTADELQLLTHVRTTEDDADLAVIFSNRLPQASGASTVHLLSVEGRYKDGRFSAPAGDVTLISLASWRFSSDPAAPTFQRRMAALTVAPEPNRVPLKHRLRNGQRTVSWYRSPFSSAPAGLPHWDDVDHADELLGMADGRMDVTYAAAWELGRLLTLRQKQVASQLYLWKRRHVRYVQSVRRQLIHQTRDIHWPADLPEAVADWFDALRTLAPVPLSYFVPSEDLLPPESIRLFQVDAVWVEQLLAGAFAVGHTAADATPLPEAPAPAGTPQCGCLIRSSVVLQRSHLIVEASGSIAALADDDLTDPLERIRQDILAPGLMVCLFKGERIQTLDVSIKPEALHAGFEAAPSGGIQKRPRDASGAAKAAVPVALGPARRVQIAGFKQQLAALNGFSGPINAAEMAMALIEGMERVRWRRMGTGHLSVV